MDDIDTREKINIKMKDSGVDWIGKVPIEWSKYKLKYIANFLLGGTPENKEGINIEEKGYPWITAPNIKNNRFYIDEFTQYISEEIVKKNNIKIFPKNSILLVCIASIGKICMIQNEMYANQQITAIISKSNFNNRYILYSVYASLDKMIFDATSSNVVPILNTQYLSNMEYIIPLITEQQKIADFLDSKCQKIDDTIKKINKQIEVLKKYKQSLITEVVTKGIDKNVPMKDSGVDWIGKIPKKWEVKRLKYVINSLVKGNGITKEEVIEDGDTPCVRYGELYTKYNHSFDKCVSYTNKDIIENKQYFYKGSILFTCTGELIEEIGKSIVYKGNDECLAGGDILVVKTSENAEFINYVSNSYAQIQKSIGKAKLKVVHISAFDISNLLIAIPTIDEQIKIVEFLNSKCLKIDNILDKKSKQIETLERYKKSLIYEYVTGKKRV